MPQAQPMTEAMLLHFAESFAAGARLRDDCPHPGALGRACGDGAGHAVWRTDPHEGEGLIVLASEQERRKTYAITQKGLDALRVEYRRLKHMVQDGAALEEQT